MKGLFQGLLAPVLVVSAMFALADETGLQDAAEAEKNLTELRGRILELQKEARKEVERRGSAEQALRAAEMSEAAVRRKMQQIDAELAATRRRLSELERQAAESESELTRHRSELERQLRLAYVAGRQDWLRTVLSQRDPVSISRQMVYYSYFARQRSGLMDTVRAQLQALAENAAAVNNEENRQAEFQRAQQERLQELSEVRRSRREALARVDKKIASHGDRLDRLRKEASDLESLVAELTRLVGNLSIDDAISFADRKGRMAWPAEGRPIRKFGQSKAGGRLRWDGVLLAAGAGTEVQAIHHGRVVFSDWLPGMGLLVVVEHGDGYLSLYGHNQDLIMEVGEWVTPGTVIAHVGDSGGQAMPGLYFEIRKGGAPIDPGPWIGH